MRLIKMFGLAACAALASMAFVGASTASADSLCHVNSGHTGLCASPLANNSLILGTATGAVLLGKELTVILKCNSHALGKLIKNKGAHVGLEVLLELLNFTACEGPCKKATGENLPVLLAIAKTLTVNVLKHPGSALGPGATLEECTFGTHCLYSIRLPATLAISGDKLIADHEVLDRGALCTLSAVFPVEGFWDATYLISLHSDATKGLFITSLP